MRCVALVWNPCDSEEELGHFGQVSNPPVPTVLNSSKRVLTVPTSPQGFSEDSNSDCGPKGSAHVMVQS